ncbi:MAG: M28 family peptidase [Solibacteraceae bacterium]|nr:M28 family peptidase [Solibacteraceae bacterium]
MLIVHTDATAGYGYHVVKANRRPQPQVGQAGEALALRFAGWITQVAGEKLFKMSGNSVESMLKRADTRGFRAVPLNVRARLSMKYKVTEMETYNVVGKVAGNGAADEAVVFSAHLDHLGVGDPVNGDAIYNGALDNATGCALLIEIQEGVGADGAEAEAVGAVRGGDGGGERVAGFGVFRAEPGDAGGEDCGGLQF